MPGETPPISQTALVSQASLGWKYLDPRLKDVEILRSIYQAAELEGARSHVNKEKDWLVETGLPTANAMAKFRNACLPHLIIDAYRKKEGIPMHENAMSAARQPLDTPLKRPVRVEGVRILAVPRERRREADLVYRLATL